MSRWGPIFSGLITIICILFGISLLLSLLLHFTSMTEASIEWFLLPLTLLTLFIGGVVSGYKSGTKGWYFGGMTGILFLLLIWLVSYLGFDMTLSSKNLTLYLFYFLLSLIGGIVGVNMSPQRSTS